MPSTKTTPSSTTAICKNTQSSGKSLRWTDLGPRLMADFNSKVFSQKAECQREGRVPDGVVSPSSGPHVQGSLYSASFGFGCLSTAN